MPLGDWRTGVWGATSVAGRRVGGMGVGGTRPVCGLSGMVVTPFVIRRYSTYMTQNSNTGAGTGAAPGPRAFGSGYLLGVPLGDLGWFSSLLMGVALGFA